MASPNSTFTEIVTTTLRNHKKEIADNVSENNALLARLKKKGQMEVVSGGYEIVCPLDYAENSTYQRYSGYDTLNISASDVLSAAKFDWKQQAINVVASGIELRKNSGKEQIIKLTKSRLKNAFRTFANELSSDVFSDGTATNQINGLQALVSTAGTGTVGGINSSTFAFWLSIVQSAASPLQGGSSITPSSSTIQSLMLPLWLALTRGTDSPDLIIMDDTYFTFYEESLTDVKRYTGDQDTATGGFVSLKYKTADVIYESSGSGMSDATGYFLNTNYLGLTTHKDANMTELPDRTPVNQDAVVMPIINQCNLTVSNRSLQGQMKA